MNSIDPVTDVPPARYTNAMLLANLLNTEDQSATDTKDPGLSATPPPVPAPSAKTASAFSNMMTTKKRALSSASAATNLPGGKKTKSKTDGTSRAAIWERLQNARFRDGQLDENPTRLLTFREKIAELDKGAKVVDVKHILHSKCGKVLAIKYPYSVRNFETHLSDCKGPPKSNKYSTGTGNNQQITNFFGSKTSLGLGLVPARTSSSTSSSLPCPGIDEALNSMVAGYLDRTGGLGGGASSVTSIAWDLYGKRYRQLSDAWKKVVCTSQMHKWMWKNNHDLGKVFSTQ